MYLTQFIIIVSVYNKPARHNEPRKTEIPIKGKLQAT